MAEAEKTRWWLSLLTPQTVVIILGGFASLVLFWNTQTDHGNSIDAIQRVLPLKADQSEVEAMINKTQAEVDGINDKQNRQYEQIRTVLDRIIVVEKQLEYQRGKQDGIKEKR